MGRDRVSCDVYYHEVLVEAVLVICRSECANTLCHNGLAATQHSMIL